jgi:branched-chain amino acid transport system permease protein
LLGFPVLRMHGDYLAIVTLGFGEIIRLILNNWLAFTGGLTASRPLLPPSSVSSLAGALKKAACRFTNFST